jgi:hypothetical protein
MATTMSVGLVENVMADLPVPIDDGEDEDLTAGFRAEVLVTRTV